MVCKAGKTFYFHSELKKSFWKLPDELKGINLGENRPNALVLGVSLPSFITGQRAFLPGLFPPFFVSG